MSKPTTGEVSASFIAFKEQYVKDAKRNEDDHARILDTLGKIESSLSHLPCEKDQERMKNIETRIDGIDAKVWAGVLALVTSVVSIAAWFGGKFFDSLGNK